MIKTNPPFEILIIGTMSILMTLIVAFPYVYGHTFSQNENSLFLTRMGQAHAQLDLVGDFLSNNTNHDNIKSVLSHVIQAKALLNAKDPVNNFTWNQEIGERNQRVAADLIRGLNNLQVSLNHDPSISSSSKQLPGNSETSLIKDKIDRLSGLLDEAVSARVVKDEVNNSTNQAMVLANMGNEIFYSYGQAVGIPYTKLANMVATMKLNANNSNNNKAPAMANKANIVNESQYENAKVYVKQAQEIVSKYLKSSASNNNAASDTQLQLNKILSQLKKTIGNRGQLDLQLCTLFICNYIQD